ncbi:MULTISPECIES: ribosome biogenesis GTP-binding protein YihA/YsxC [Carboxydocella]|uniref:Probable GTP-binding protein EngB n=2 Tax=Carboxydocella TaxID=178898 RepID=A0A1T4LDC5_9FIRM|nr:MULTISPECIES: ribosome biogenesis GTP-binding protein YihA/YsxC [Carboxydocella]AVX19840.1 GTP-binding protein [Carboxydocella thermautotrophica]AVX30249.1 GTP-binding protein [Carboxydocella thermautotrophica]SJZ52631.1 GTP-binding protein [Carboxydocella sporoproducens DSM 16521]GAW28665.1 YihA family ribosome biogenesis GTP-binding protein [Carboxydocella sp. ULO1]GAW30510.1 YihA family ribosome biogenesis GTP-binding protein [Carboxydocella sp. JDF658]
MKIIKAEYTVSAVKAEQYPQDGRPEIAFAGRSNVGKSSLINTLVQRKNLARTSSQPGKTQTINFYSVNDLLYLVDLPGYGFARVSRAERERWGRFIEAYLNQRRELVAVVLLVDIRHPPTRDDVMMYDWLCYFNKPTLVVATKADKISRGQWAKHLKIIRNELGLKPEHQLLPFSAETRQGREEVWDWLARAAGITEENGG